MTLLRREAVTPTCRGMAGVMSALCGDGLCGKGVFGTRPE